MGEEMYQQTAYPRATVLLMTHGRPRRQTLTLFVRRLSE